MKFEQIRDIVTIHKGKKHKITDKNSGLSRRVLQIDDLRNDDFIKYTDDKTGVVAKADDILIAWDGANAGTVGFGKVGFIGSTIAVLRKKKPEKYNTIFLGKFLQSQFSYLRKKTTGATIPHIDRKSLELLKVPIIELTSQFHIAYFLTITEDLIKQRKESICLLDEFLKSTFLEMFGDAVKNEKKWNKSELKNYAKVRIGPFGSLLHREDYVQNGIPLVNPSHIGEGKIFIDHELTISKNKMKELSAYVMHEGDVVLGRRGEIGRCAVVTKKEEGYLCGTGSIYIRPTDELNPIFLYNIISSDSMRKVLENSAKGITMKNLNSGIIENLKIPVPPIKIQTQFAQIVEKTEALREQYNTSLQELENLYGSLSQLAFKGELVLSKMQLLQDEKDEERFNLEQQQDHRNQAIDFDLYKETQSPFQNVKNIVATVTNYEPVFEDVLPFITQKFQDKFFTFEDLKKATIKESWNCDFETLKTFIFDLLRDYKLKQVFADATFKSEIKEDSPTFRLAKDLEEKMYLQRIIS